jgi:hypothetical protein
MGTSLHKLSSLGRLITNSHGAIGDSPNPLPLDTCRYATSIQLFNATGFLNECLLKQQRPMRAHGLYYLTESAQIT